MHFHQGGELGVPLFARRRGLAPQYRAAGKFGGTLFNSVYSVALLALRDHLLEAGVILRVREHDAVDFLQQGSEFDPCNFCEESDNDVPVVDAAFVDDEALVVMAKTPHAFQST